MFNLKKVYNGIYLLEFNSHIDLVSHFMRFQEIYESQNPNFNHKPFELIDFIKWYTETNSDSYNFSYYSDWAGFNIPLNIITDFYDKISDKNSHDHFMKSIAEYIEKDCNIPAYLIGAQSGNNTTMRHEVAHGLFYTDHEYKDAMLKIISTINKDKINDMYEILTGLGYSESVLDDEVQAFAATGLYGTMKRSFKKKETDLFKNYFQSYIKSKKIAI